MLYYNADLFAAAKLTPPRSWDELGKDAAALTVDGGKTRWGIEIPTETACWTFQPLSIGAGKNVFTDDVTVNFNAPEVVAAVQYYVDLSQKYKATPPGVQVAWGTSTQNFAAGKTAMIVHTTGSLTGILKTAKFKVGVMAVPGRTPGTLASVTGGGNIYLTAGHTPDEHKAAFAFMQYLLDPSRVAAFSQATGYIPNRTAATSTPEFKAWLAQAPQAADAMAALASAQPELAAYAFAWHRFAGDRLLFTVILLQMMIPTAALLVPNFSTIRFLKLYDTIPGIALPFFGSAFATFLLRQTFLSLPRDLADAASIDGFRWDQELRHVYLATSRASLAAIVLSSLSYHWNDFLWPLVITRSDRARPLTAGLVRFTQMGEIGAQWGLLSAATMIVTLPLFIAFVIFQRQFVRGYISSGIK